MKVLIPGALLSYTGQDRVEADGATAADVLDGLDRLPASFPFHFVRIGRIQFLDIQVFLVDVEDRQAEIDAARPVHERNSRQMIL